MQTIKKTYGLIQENLTGLLVVTPLVNIVSFPLLFTLHWMTGKFGYLVASFFCALGILILFCVVVLNREIRLNGRTVFNFIMSAGLLYLAYVDIQILGQALINNGFIPCPFGASCP